MSCKHNTQHPDRGRSHYPERLRKRGLGKTPEMESLNSLRKRQHTTEGTELAGSDFDGIRDDAWYLTDDYGHDLSYAG